MRLADNKQDTSIAKSKVVLVGFKTDQDRYEAVKKLSQLLGINFDEAADLADSAPIDLIPSIPREAAQNIGAKLTEAGALVDVLPITKTSHFCDFHPNKYARRQCKTCGKYICNICLAQSKGREFCAEHYEIFKQKRVLIVVGSAFFGLLALFLVVFFRHPVARLWKYLTPLHEIKVAAVFVSDNPSTDKSAYFMKTFAQRAPDEYRPGDDHTIADIPSWFNKSFREFTLQRSKIMSMTMWGMYEITAPPPAPPVRLNMSYRALHQRLDYKSYFENFLETNGLMEMEPQDIVILIDLEDGAGVDKDFMEYLGFASGRFAYVRFPLKDRLWSNDYYIAAVAHFIARCMGADLQLNDKGFPKNPEGLADPAQRPLYAQNYASLSGCYRAAKEFEIERPSSLDQYVVSPIMAYEFGWIPYRRISKLYPGL